MDKVTATFSIPDWIKQGLKNGNYIRIGGVIRDAQTKQVVAMLREAVPSLTQAASLLSQLGSVASILNLAVSVIGFVIVIQRLGEIDKRLNCIQKELKQLHYKFDLSVNVNFKAALDLARNAFTMTKNENRVSQANLAINRLLEAQHTYIDYVDKSLEEEIQVADEYISLLLLTYVAISRCYLELEEIETARRYLQESTEFIYERIQKYVDKVFPYLNKEEQDKFSKKRSLLIPPLYITVNGDITGVLGGWTTIAPMISVLSAAEIAPTGLLAAITPLGLLGVFSPKKEEKPQFPEALSKIEAVIETQQRFEAYHSEIQAIAQLGLSFHEWLKLAPSEAKPDEAELMYIIPDKPLDVAFAS